MKNKRGSSETTREAFCFDLYFQYKPQHKNIIKIQFLEWFIGFSEGDCTFHTWVDRGKKRAGFTIDQQDCKVLYWIKKELGFGRVLACKKGWRFQVWDKRGLLRLYCIFYGNLVLNKRHLKFQKYTNFLIFPTDFSIPITSCNQAAKNTLSGSNFISLDNAWLAGFWQADGGFYAWAKFDLTHIILRAYITQKAEAAALQQIAIVIHGNEKTPLGVRFYRTLSILENKKTKTQYNRVEFASQACLLQIFFYFKKFVLVGEKKRTFLRWKRIWEIREKIKNNEIIVTEKSIRKLKRLISATKKTK